MLSWFGRRQKDAEKDGKVRHREPYQDPRLGFADQPCSYFYESGDVTNASYNKGNVPFVVLQCEILPVDWKGGSGVPPKSK